MRSRRSKQASKQQNNHQIATGYGARTNCTINPSWCGNKAQRWWAKEKVEKEEKKKKADGVGD